MSGLHQRGRSACQPCLPCTPAVLPERPLQIREIAASELKDLVSEETYSNLGKPGALNDLLKKNNIQADSDVGKRLTDIAALQATGLQYSQVFSGRTEYFMRQDTANGASRIMYRFKDDNDKVVVGTISSENGQIKHKYAGQTDLNQLASLERQKAGEAARVAAEQKQREAEQQRQQAELARQQEEQQRAQQAQQRKQEQTLQHNYDALLASMSKGERYRASDSQFERNLGREYAATEAQLKADTSAFLAARNVGSFEELGKEAQTELMTQLVRTYREDFQNYDEVHANHLTSLSAVDAKQHGAERAALAARIGVTPEQMDTVAAALDTLKQIPGSTHTHGSDEILKRIRQGSPEFRALPEETQKLLGKLLTLPAENARGFVWSTGKYYDKLAAPAYEEMRGKFCGALGLPSDRESLDDIAVCVGDAREKRDALYSFLRSQGIEDPANASEASVIARLALKADGMEALKEAQRLYGELRNSICDLPQDTQDTVWALMRAGGKREALDSFLKEHGIKTLGYESQDKIMERLAAIQAAQPEGQRQDLTGRAQELYAGLRESVSGAPEAQRETLYQTAVAGDPTHILSFIVLDSDAAARGQRGSAVSHDYLHTALEYAAVGRRRAGAEKGIASNEPEQIRDYLAKGGFTALDG